MPAFLRVPLLRAALTIVWLPSLAFAAEDISPEEREFFEQEVRPILVRRCQECHSAKAEDLEGDLRLDSRAGWEEGGYQGPAIIPGKPEESLIMRAVRYDDPDLQMPPQSKMPQREIEILRKWIAEGAPDPRTESQAEESTREEFDLAERKEDHWAWQSITQPGTPEVGQRDWPADSLDAFILARLEEAGLAPAEQAQKATWLRRVTFALTGLPPTISDIEAFLADDAQEAYERVVDRLLDSPHYGERWAQHWLDLVRYAETRGHEQDFAIPEAYRYRDYVIRAFNADVTYDQFVTEHIAGDLVDPPRVNPGLRTNESIQGTGFWHLGEATHSPVDIRGDEADRVANQIDVFSKTFLGLTIGCARCHDHKFDAITTADYYALCGFLQSSSYHLADVSDPVAQQAAAEALGSLREKQGPTVLDAWKEYQLSQLKGAEEYLTAALEILSSLSKGLQTDEEEAINETSSAIQEAAQSQGLDPVRLQTWARQLADAERDPSHPLHAFARISQRLNKHQALDTLREEILKEWQADLEAVKQRAKDQKVVATVEQGERNYVSQERDFTPEDVSLDYAQPGPDDWLVVGQRFGHAPRQPGEVFFGDSAEKAVRWLAEEPAAASDYLSAKFSGMLRTRTFEVAGDTLWYRYRGNAKVFLVVDSHRVVAGPLHGVVKQELKGNHEFQWFGHNVRDYIGHRVHVEFTPLENFELSRIQFGADEPPAEVTAHPETLSLMREPAVNDLAALAVNWRQILADAISRAVSGEMDSSCSAADARLVNWWLAHEELGDMDVAAGAKLQAAFREFQARREEIEATIPEPTPALTLIDGSGEDEFVHIRGSHRQLAATPVTRRSIAVLDGEGPLISGRGSGRMRLAQRLVAEDNPLVARVMVNRLWHHMFGRGLVPTVDDFGAMGQPPSHPLLLDHLASTFMADGWSIKRLLKRMALSSTYRMSSYPGDARAEQFDPTNRLLHRMPIRRLEGEAVRDSLLALSGELDDRLFGPSVMVHITSFMRSNRSPSGSGPMDSDGRRSIYIEVRRNHLSHFLSAFDRPVPFTTIGGRMVSNSPAQPLILLNDPLVHEQARLWAERLCSPENEPAAARIERAYLMALGRPLESWEMDLACEFLNVDNPHAPWMVSNEEDLQAWADFCHTLINMKEFIFLN